MPRAGGRDYWHHNLLKASYVREDAEIDGAFACIFGQIRLALFPALGATSPMRWQRKSPPRNPITAWVNPYSPYPKTSATSSARTESYNNMPLVSPGPLQSTVLSLLYLCVAPPSRSSWPYFSTALKLGKAVVFRAAEHALFPADVKRDVLKLEGWRARLERRARQRLARAHRPVLS